MNTKVSKRDESAIWRKALSFGLPKYLVVPTITAFFLWGNSSGWEFAISRFKAMKTNLLRDVAGLDPIWEIGQYPSKGIGWYKGLVTLSRKSDTLFSQCVSLLNVYTSVIFEDRTKAQEEKFTSSIQAEPVGLSNRFMGTLKNMTLQLPSVTEVETPRWYLDKIWSEHRRTPSVGVSSNGKLDMFVTRPEIGGVADSSLLLLAGTNGGDLLDLIDSYPFLEPVLHELTSFSNKSLVDKFGLQAHRKVGLLGGTISFIQEAGGKLRSVANPYRWWQAALEPLANSIHSILKELPWDCTHDQEQAIPAVQASLSRGEEWFSVDISSATDHFPLEYQVGVLRQIYSGLPQAQAMISLFSELSRLPWWYKSISGSIQMIAWRKGQPMGLRPSFGSFALTHGLVLLALNQGEWNEDFYVLGDDVIIRGEKLHRRYRHFLDRHEIPVSESKTLRGLYAEFASKIITPSQVIPIYKWRKSTPDNFVDLARLWGPHSYPLFSKRARKVLDKLSNVPPIYGGLGWGDPNGYNYSVPKWIGKEIGRGVDVSLIRNYVAQIYSSDSVSKVGVVPALHPLDVSDKTNQVITLIDSVMGITTTSDSLIRSLASNLVRENDISLPSSKLGLEPLSSLEQWESRLGL